MQTTPLETTMPLTLEVAEVKNELITLDTREVDTISADPALIAQADDLVTRLFAIDPENIDTAQEAKHAVEDMGVRLQNEAGQKSAMLKTPINTLAKRGDDGGPVANALVELKLNVEALDPMHFDFEPGWFSRTLGFLPFIGKPVKRYFTKYENAETVLDAIMNSLRDGRETLKRDNITLSNDQQSMRSLSSKLSKSVCLAQLIDKKISSRLETEIPSDAPQYRFIQEELLFPLRQRIQDLQQQLVVNQQGVLAMELIIRNNKELMRGVNRCLNVTVNALQVAVTVALALANQKIVLNKIKMVNETTDDLISGTAQMLKEQGAEIHKQAADTMLSMDNLKKAFTDLNLALEDISQYRRQTLPQMASQILELNELADKQGEAVERMQRGNAQASQFVIEVE